MPGGPIASWANFLIAGRGTGHDEQSLQFTAYDLPLYIGDPDDASRVARDVWSDLSGSTVLQRVAVDLVNQHMETATLRVSNLGGGKLYDTPTSGAPQSNRETRASAPLRPWQAFQRERRADAIEPRGGGAGVARGAEAGAPQR